MSQPRNVNLATDEGFLLADIAASLRLLTGRPLASFTDTIASFPEDVPAKEPELPRAPEVKPEQPKPAPKAVRPPKTKTGDGGGA
jgi:hypothetical protein